MSRLILRLLERINVSPMPFEFVVKRDDRRTAKESICAEVAP